MYNGADTVKSGVLEFCGHSEGVMGDHRSMGISLEYKASVLMQGGEGRSK